MRSRRSSSPTERSDDASRLKIARRFGSAMIANEDSTSGIYSLGHMNVKAHPQNRRILSVWRPSRREVRWWRPFGMSGPAGEVRGTVPVGMREPGGGVARDGGSGRAGLRELSHSLIWQRGAAEFERVRVGFREASRRGTEGHRSLARGVREPGPARGSASKPALGLARARTWLPTELCGERRA